MNEERFRVECERCGRRFDVKGQRVSHKGARRRCARPEQMANDPKNQSKRLHPEISGDQHGENNEEDKERESVCGEPPEKDWTPERCGKRPHHRQTEAECESSQERKGTRSRRCKT